MKPDLNQLLDHLGAHAHNMLLIERQKELMPMYHLCPEEGPDLVIGCPWRDLDEKLLVLHLIKQKAREINATCLGFLSEVWMTQHPTANLDVNNVTPPSLDPQRIECVLAMVTDGDEVKTRSWEIVRDKDGVITQLQQKDFDGFMTGRMVDGLLPKRKTVH